MIKSQAQNRFEKQREALKKGDIKTVKQIAEEIKKEESQSDLVDAWPLYRRMPREWFEKATIQEKVIRLHSDQYGYIIVCEEKEVEETIGFRGRVPIIVKKKKLDCSKFWDFDKRYKEYQEKKEKQQEAINHEIQNIVEKEQNESNEKKFNS